MQLLVRDRRAERINDVELLLVRHHLEVLRRKVGRPALRSPRCFAESRHRAAAATSTGKVCSLRRRRCCAGIESALAASQNQAPELIGSPDDQWVDEQQHEGMCGRRRGPQQRPQQRRVDEYRGRRQLGDDGAEQVAVCEDADRPDFLPPRGSVRSRRSLSRSAAGAPVGAVAASRLCARTLCGACFRLERIARLPAQSRVVATVYSEPRGH
jgi:hypothetical protein